MTISSLMFAVHEGVASYIWFSLSQSRCAAQTPPPECLIFPLRQFSLCGRMLEKVLRHFQDENGDSESTSLWGEYGCLTTSRPGKVDHWQVKPFRPATEAVRCNYHKLRHYHKLLTVLQYRKPRK